MSVYPYFNAPDRRKVSPYNRDDEYNYGMAPSMIRDLSWRARHVAPRQDGQKAAPQPNPYGDMVFQPISETGAYYGNDHHNWIEIPRGNHFRPSDYPDDSRPQFEFHAQLY